MLINENASDFSDVIANVMKYCFQIPLNVHLKLIRYNEQIETGNLDYN